MSKKVAVSAHTPGPWKVHRVSDGDEVISRGVEGPDGRGINRGEEFELFSEADATLIAAAPELLGIAKSVAEDVARGEPCPICSEAPHRRDCALVAAIAKAEGGDPPVGSPR